MKNLAVVAPVVVTLMTGLVLLSLNFPENHFLGPLTVGLSLAGLMVACLSVLLYGIAKLCGAGRKVAFLSETAITLSAACGATIWIMSSITDEPSLGSLSVVSAVCFVAGVVLSEVRAWRAVIVVITIVAIVAGSPLIFMQCSQFWSVVFASVALNVLVAFCVLCENHDNKYCMPVDDQIDTPHSDPP